MCFHPGYTPLQQGKIGRVNYFHRINNIGQNFVKVSRLLGFSPLRVFGSELAELIESSWLTCLLLVRDLVKHDSLG